MDSRVYLPPKLMLMRQELYIRADWMLAGVSEPPERIAYVKEHKLNLQEINAHAGLFAVCLCQVAGQHFDFFPDGVPTAVIEVLAEDGETVIDLVAFPLNAPERFVTAVGEADMLGIANMRSTEQCKFNKPLLVHRTPLNWLKANCRGCVVLNPQWGGYWLRRNNREILAEDLAHGRELWAMLRQKYTTRTPLPQFDMKRVLVPVSREKVA